MPTYRGIQVNLFNDEANKIEELNFAPPELGASSDASTTLRHSTSSSGTIVKTAPSHAKSRPFVPALRNDARNTLSVIVPVMPKSLFFLRYQVMEHEQYQAGTEELLYVFKLLINGLEVTTWHCGPQHDYKGKAMFGLFDTGDPEYDDGNGVRSGDDAQNNWGKGMQKRLWRFGERDFRVVGDLRLDGEDKRRVEVRVCRANVKVRIVPELNNFNSRYGPAGPLLLPYGGPHHQFAPARFYKYGLLDPVDEPYAVFRFYYRTWAEINDLNIHMGQVNTQDALIFNSASTLDTTILNASPTTQSKTSFVDERDDRYASTSTIRSLGASSSAKSYLPTGAPFTVMPEDSLPSLHIPDSPISPERSPVQRRTQDRESWNSQRFSFAKQDTSYGNAFSMPMPPSRLSYGGESVPSPVRYPARDSMLPRPDSHRYNYHGYHYSQHYGPHQSFYDRNMSASPAENQFADQQWQVAQARANVEMLDRRLSIPPSVLLQPLIQSRSLVSSPLRSSGGSLSDDYHQAARNTSLSAAVPTTFQSWNGPSSSHQNQEPRPAATFANRCLSAIEEQNEGNLGFGKENAAVADHEKAGKFGSLRLKSLLKLKRSFERDRK